MNIGIPEYERKQSAVALRGNLKMVVETVKDIKSAIAEAESDKKRDRSATIKQLQVNLAHIMNWGKTLQEKIRAAEATASFQPHSRV